MPQQIETAGRAPRWTACSRGDNLRESNGWVWRIDPGTCFRPRSSFTIAVRLFGAVVLFFGLTGCATKRLQPEWVYFPAPPATPHVVHLKSFNSLSDLVPPHVTFVDMIRGESPSPYVEKPAGIDYRDGHLYVCDTGLNVVHDWNLATGDVRRIGRHGKVVLQKPVDVAVGVGGTLFVADTNRREVIAFDESGTFRERYRPSNGDAFRPTAVDVTDGKDPMLAVTDAANHGISLFTPGDGGLFKRGDGTALFDTISKGANKPYFPTGVAIEAPSNDLNKGGTVFVSDVFQSRILAYDTKGGTTRAIGQPGDRYGDLGHPKHLDVGPDGVIFVADSAFRCVHLFNQKGRLLMLLGGPDNQPGGTPMPLGVAVAPSLPENLQPLVPPDFDAHYYLFVTNTVGTKRISLFAVGLPWR